MNGDDITFGEVKVREPERRKRPDRDRKFACMSYEVPAKDDLPVFLERKSADAIERHALSDTSVELGGILLGKECVDPASGEPFVWITHSLEAKHYANTQASFTYTHDSWEEITRERDRRFPEYDIVGWYHTHPNFGIFLSHHDLFIHHNFFSQPLQVAYVVDPINQTRGIFQWRDGGMKQVAGYYLVADRGDRVALARLANDLEQLPNPEAGSGGTLSPRLEAELIKMLTRPGHRDVSSPAAGLQSATLYGLVGMFMGVMGLAAVLWLGQLLGKVQQQNESIQALTRVVEDSATRQRQLSDGLMEKAGIASPIEFTELLAHADKERDDAKKKLENERVKVDSLASNLKSLESDNSRLAKELVAANGKLDQYKKDVEEVADLRARVADLGADNTVKQRMIDKFQPWFETEDGKAVVAMEKDLRLYRNLTYIGWVFCAMLGCGLAAAYFLLKPLPSTPLEGGAEIERPTHRIE